MSPTTFRAPLEAGGPSYMPTQMVVVPAAVVAALGLATQRVLATFNGKHTEQLGLLPLPGGGWHLLLRKALREQLGLKSGQEVTISLAPDPNPDHVNLPHELSEALATWPEAEAAFLAHTAYMRRAIARHVAEAKRAETRARRAVEMAGRLAQGQPPFRIW